MTWYFSPSAETVDVYDHTGTLVVDGAPFSGSWSGKFPNGVFDLMYQEALDAYEAGNTQRMLAILADAAFERIEEGTPA